MNNGRRNMIANAANTIKEAARELEVALMEEEMYVMNMPENLSYSMKCMDAEENINTLQQVTDIVNEAVSDLSEAVLMLGDIL